MYLNLYMDNEFFSSAKLIKKSSEDRMEACGEEEVCEKSSMALEI